MATGFLIVWHQERKRSTKWAWATLYQQRSIRLTFWWKMWREEWDSEGGSGVRCEHDMEYIQAKWAQQNQIQMLLLLHLFHPKHKPMSIANWFYLKIREEGQSSSPSCWFFRWWCCISGLRRKRRSFEWSSDPLRRGSINTQFDSH